MASPFKTKVSMMKIMDDFFDKLKNIGYVILKHKDEGHYLFYIGNEYIGDMFISYQKEYRQSRKLIFRRYTTVKVYHTVEYNKDEIIDAYNIRVRDNSNRDISEHELYVLDEMVDELSLLYRNYKKAQDKVKELKMHSDFSF